MWAATFLCVIHLFAFANGAKILGIFMTPSYSHQVVFQPIWKELSLRGHQVTVYTPLPLNDQNLSNLTEYDLKFSFEHVKGIDKAAYDVGKVFQMFVTVTEAQLEHRYMQDLLKNTKNETYDLLLVEYLWTPYYAFKEIYNIPMVGITSLPLTINAADSLGMEKHQIVDPDMFLPFSRAETIKERVVSWAYNWIYRIYRKFKFAPTTNNQIRKYFKNVTKTTVELANEVSLVIGNFNFALQAAKPFTPNFIPISGIHIQPEKPLPKKLAEVLNNLKTDAIYFSLGTNVNTSSIAETQVKKIINVLGKLPFTILWKSNSDQLSTDLPKNFYSQKWFPQQDILAHPRVKLFITQGGIQSADEALSRRVPMLMIPFLADQRANSDRCVKLGIAEMIDFTTFTEEEFKEKIEKLLSNLSYQRNIEKQSAIATDEPISALDKAIFWIEYVIRHNGAPHLRYSAVDLPFYKYYLLDVYLFVAVFCSVLYYISRKIIAIILLSIKALHRLVFGNIEKLKSS